MSIPRRLETLMSRPARQALKRRPAVPAADARAELLDAAEELFYREGARNVGVDAVVKRAGLNKMSLYRQFASKDELMDAYLARREDRFWRYFEDSVARFPRDPAAGLRQFFVDLAARTQAAGYRGCPFVNIACEFPEPDHPTRRRVADHKAELLSRLTGLAQAAGARDPAALADALALLIEGAYAASRTYGSGNPLLAALPRVAGTLIEAACTADRSSQDRAAGRG